jgi:hypothetical protein
MIHAILCPQCNAPLKPHPFARSIVCAFCGTTVKLDETSVPAERFHASYRVWNSPASYGISNWVSIGERHWAVEQLIASGDGSDVYAARRARWPTERVILKVMRTSGSDCGRESDRGGENNRSLEAFENEWNVLEALQQSNAQGAATFTALLPAPVLHGDVTGGLFEGRRASIYRRAHGFRHNFDEVIWAYPQGIPARASVWVWRRILEVLSFVHASGMVHGAVLPRHLLVQDNEHGVRLVGYGLAGKPGEVLPPLPPDSEAYYPLPGASALLRSPQLDLMMSARCVVALLGGDPATGIVPAGVPARLAEVVQRVARQPLAGQTAWALREELGEIADQVFGAPQFIPIAMPD